MPFWRYFVIRSVRLLFAATAALAFCFSMPAIAQFGPPPAKPTGPWMNKSLSPDQRADLLIQKLTLDQKIQLLHGTGMSQAELPNPLAAQSNGGAGFVPGFPEYGIPGIQMADSAYGVTLSGRNGRYSTALPSDLGAAATWNPKAAYAYGALIGQELRDQGYTMSLGGGVDIARDPRDGRTFEYQGEDPLLAGTMVGNLIRGVQAQHMIGDIKHYAVNDQEAGRMAVNSVISERAMRESDLLAFQIGVEIGNPGGVMCSYNRVNGDYACENDYLLNKVLKQDWKYPGFVVSDWTATHSTVKASHAGLDNEEPFETFYGDALKKAVQDGQVSMAELNDHVHRMLRSEFADGIVDDPPQKIVVPALKDLQAAKEMAEQSIVLLKNQDNVLPLNRSAVHSIVVIGRHADVGMISGGGSAQVDPPGGNAVPLDGHKESEWMKGTWFPDAPLKSIQDAANADTKVTFDDGTDPSKAADAAKGADIALVYVYQWESEGMDLKSLALGGNQNELVAAVAKANPHTIVVLENGSPVLMAWIHDVAGVLETWYSGSDGANAIAAVLFGDVNPSAKLPITFPLADADLPHPVIPQPPAADTENWSNPLEMLKRIEAGLPSFDAHYNEGLEVGYKWYDAQHKQVLFPFGFGLSYTTYSYSDMMVDNGGDVTVHLTVKNTGSRAGTEIAEVYSTMPAAAQEPPKRLVGWTRVMLQPGEQKDVTVALPRSRFNIWNEKTHGWEVMPGEYTLMAGPSSAELPLKKSMKL
jgi:beta-glucosidase